MSTVSGHLPHFYRTPISDEGLAPCQLRFQTGLPGEQYGTVPAFRARLGTDAALARMREIAAAQLRRCRRRSASPKTPAARGTRPRHGEEPRRRPPAGRGAVPLRPLIADLVNLPPGTPGIGARLRDKARRVYDIPGTDRTRVAAETLRDWVRLYRPGGFDALHPRPRADLGRFPPDCPQRSPNC